MNSERNLEFGNVEESDAGVAELPLSGGRPSLHLSKASLRWRPPEDLASNFHSDFYIAFDVYSQEDGTRRFLPGVPPKTFIDNAFLAGLHLLARDRRLTSDMVACYRQQKLIFDRVLVMQEHMERSFAHSRDLYIRRSGRQSDEDRSILPMDLRFDSNGDGRTWNVTRLCEEGRARAHRNGLTRPNKQQEISYGLLRAAELNPLTIPETRVESLVRSALFAIPDAIPAPNNDLLEEVYDRMTDRLNSHHADTNDEFDNWLKGRNSNLFKSIGGRAIAPSQVRAAFLELGWQSYQYVSGSISYLCQAFAVCLPNRMDELERELFAHTFQPQSYLGGLPLILFMERAQVLGLMIHRLWSNPGAPDDIRVLHRLLDYYSRMARSRRESDNLSKQRNGRIEATIGESVKGLAAAQCSSLATESVAVIINELLERREVRCKTCDGALEADLTKSPLEDSVDTFKLFCHCPEHGGKRMIKTTQRELFEIAEAMGFDGSDI
ncbi:hypothetical protein [Bremerella alba]|uniref:Uncharacterized protein n=1 Tax=Bremerella alba TaxID=980252 RepID=A0A7V8V4Y6_9BACT|nr:hypothetical protein [Bremerella alba]MBA2115023.1 hypothetical protein [Bremerella alba]